MTALAPEALTTEEIVRLARKQVDAFNSGTEYQSFSPYVTRWDDTLVAFPGQHRQAAEDWVNFRLDEIVYLIKPGARCRFAHRIKAATSAALW